MTFISYSFAVRSRGRIAAALAVAALALCTAATSSASGAGIGTLVANTRSESAPATTGIPILVYHRFGPAATDSMTVSLAVFESQLRYIKEHGYHVVSLRAAVNYLVGQDSQLPLHPVVITADDGHVSVYTAMRPLIERERIPVTLFIYPSAISNASYAMTWKQLSELEATGLFTIESHTYWHPNFHIEKRRLGALEYDRFVDSQMVKAKSTLEKRLGIAVDMLAWPFGIYDDELISRARAAGYVAAFTIERRNASRRDNLMAIPRYLVSDSDRGRMFSQVLEGRSAARRPTPRIAVSSRGGEF